jgi:hypothetical protein
LKIELRSSSFGEVIVGLEAKISLLIASDQSTLENFMLAAKEKKTFAFALAQIDFDTKFTSAFTFTSAALSYRDSLAQLVAGMITDLMGFTASLYFYRSLWM